MAKNIVNIVLSALTGWVAGLITLIILSFLWRLVIPVVDRTGQGMGVVGVLVWILKYVSPVALIGGIIGGLLPREGTRKDQIIYAALFGAGSILYGSHSQALVWVLVFLGSGAGLARLLPAILSRRES